MNVGVEATRNASRASDIYVRKYCVVYVERVSSLKSGFVVVSSVHGDDGDREVPSKELS